MMFTPENLINSKKAGFEAFAFVANTSFASAERLAALNLNTARNCFMDAVAFAKDLAAAKNPEAVLALHKSAVYPAFDRSIAYSRSYYGIVSQTLEVLGKMVESNVTEINDNVVAALDKGVKHAPAGSDVVLGVVKSALASANAAYDNVKKTTRQTVELAEANVAAATDATLKTLKAA